MPRHFTEVDSFHLLAARANDVMMVVRIVGIGPLVTYGFIAKVDLHKNAEFGKGREAPVNGD